MYQLGMGIAKDFSPCTSSSNLKTNMAVMLSQAAEVSGVLEGSNGVEVQWR